LQASAFDGGASLHEDAHDAVSVVATHFGGRSFIESATRASCAQQIEADDGHSDALEQFSVAFGAHEDAARHAFICVVRLPQHTWLPLHRLRLPTGPQYGPRPASTGGVTTSGPASGGDDTSAWASTEGGIETSSEASAGFISPVERSSVASTCDSVDSS
jgi:hypothetical protein